MPAAISMGAAAIAAATVTNEYIENQIDRVRRRAIVHTTIASIRVMTYSIPAALCICSDRRHERSIQRIRDKCTGGCASQAADDQQRGADARKATSSTTEQHAKCSGHEARQDECRRLHEMLRRAAA